MRKLATVQKITTLEPIPNADTIEVASVLGWRVVVKKGEFKVGDECVYVEIDSVLPEKPEFEFLRNKKFRIKTMRLRGQISQGICFPPTILPVGLYDVGQDVTELLGITQFIPQIPANIAGLVKGPFPSFMPKTDETRVQVLQEVLSRHKGKTCFVTEKVDGSSATYYVKDGVFGVCSRNLELKETEDNLFWKMARQLKIEEKLKSLGKNIAIQGELIGLGVQGNKLKLPENHVLFFNVFDIDTFKYYDFHSFRAVITGLELETVPILETEYTLEDSIDTLIEKAKGLSALNKAALREGIVIRPIFEEFDFQMSQGFGNGRVTFKAINPEFLLKYDE